MSRILVPLRYPITVRGKKTLRKALEVSRQEDTYLIIYHVNLLYEDERISWKQFQKVVEKIIPEYKDNKKVTYSVENSYLLDESILKKIYSGRISAVIMGKSMSPRWRKFLKFWEAYKISDEIKKAAECKVIVVD
ncbi:MAG: hypothetical protein ACE5G7_02700 [Candidatus Hydrothermarchaeaceae archaeon]